jgi:hypothetical protein
MRTVDDQAGINGLLAGFHGIQGGHGLAGGHRRSTTAASNDTGAGRGRIDLQTASHLERPQEFAEPALVSSFYDNVQGVLTLHDGLALDLQPMLPDVWAA